jgi:hypothetical protein
MDNKKVVDSQLITMPVATLKKEEMKSYKKKRERRTTSLILGLLFSLLLFISLLCTIISVRNDQRTVQKKIAATVDQINKVILPALEEHIMDLSMRIDELGKETEAVKDNCTDIRYIIAPQFGKAALVPVYKIRPLALTEQKIQLPKIEATREQ